MEGRKRKKEVPGKNVSGGGGQVHKVKSFVKKLPTTDGGEVRTW